MKTLPKDIRFKRLQNLDCQNRDFEAFLMKRYLEFQEKKKAQELKEKRLNERRFLLKRMKTEEIIP